MGENEHASAIDEAQLRELMANLQYQPFYCEENVWLLAQQSIFTARPCWALFMTNERRQCAIWHQRAAEEHGFVVWDYHVALLVEEAGAVSAWDVDCSLGMPLPLAHYLDASFPELDPADQWLRPQFRLVPAGDFLATFASDRRHMLGDDGYQKPPPAWQPPRPASAASDHTLDRYIDLSDDIAGEVLTMAALRERWPAAAEGCGGH